MYYISVIDRNNKKLEIFHERSQLKLDSFTTSFDNKEDLLKQLGLNPFDFKVVVEKQMTKNDEPEEIEFLDNRYRGIVSIGESREKQNSFFDVVSRQDRRELYEFFLNEYYNRYKNIDNEYDKKREEQLNRLLELFQEEEQYKKDNSSSNQLFTSQKLSSALKRYFIDQYDKLNYDSFKNMYKLIKLLKNDLKRQELTNLEKLQLSKEMISIHQLIVKSLTPDALCFKGRKLQDVDLESSKVGEDYDFDGIVYKYDDIDDRMAELEMYMDENRMDDEQKQEYINDHSRKLF